MPVYEYACAACAHHFEATQRISDPPLTRCVACGAAQAQRQISASSFALRGSGWYVSDYGRRSPSSE